MLGCKIHERVSKKGHELLDCALAALQPGSVSDFDAFSDQRQMYAVNTLKQPRREVIRVPSDFVGCGTAPAVQKLSGSSEHLLMLADDAGTGVATPVTSLKGVPGPTGACMSPLFVASLLRMPRIATQTASGDSILENGSLKVTVSPKGRITSIYDIAQE